MEQLDYNLLYWASMKSDGRLERSAWAGPQRRKGFHGEKRSQFHACLDHRSRGAALSQGTGQGSQAQLHGRTGRVGCDLNPIELPYRKFKAYLPSLPHATSPPSTAQSARSCRSSSSGNAPFITNGATHRVHSMYHLVCSSMGEVSNAKASIWKSSAEIKTLLAESRCRYSP